MQYGQPRRLNALTVFMILVALAGSYWLWKFFPAYFDAWTVDHALKEGVSSVYSAKSLREPDRTTQLNNISEKARREIIEQAGISDPELQVNLDMEDDVATMTADYTVTIEHPVIDKFTHLHFHRVASANIKAVSWD